MLNFVAVVSFYDSLTQDELTIQRLCYYGPVMIIFNRIRF